MGEVARWLWKTIANEGDWESFDADLDHMHAKVNPIRMPTNRKARSDT